MREFERGRPHSMEYKALNGFDAVCEIHIFQHEGNTIVVATDLNVGPSVTNNIEKIASILRENGIQWDFLFEHYFDNPEDERPETFDFVEFSWRGNTAFSPQWRTGSRELLEKLIGQHFS